MSPLSGLFTVICHGFDGHVAVEIADHNHCACPEPDDSVSNDSMGMVIVSTSDHGHCYDTATDSHFIAPVRKNSNFNTHKDFVVDHELKSISQPAPFIFEPSSERDNACLPFYAPLRTVIMLT